MLHSPLLNLREKYWGSTDGEAKNDALVSSLFYPLYEVTHKIKDGLAKFD